MSQYSKQFKIPEEVDAGRRGLVPEPKPRRVMNEGVSITCN